MPTATTTDQRRAHYDAFVAHILTLCTDNGIRADLRTGRGQPVKYCHRLRKPLTRLVAGHGAKRAHYTVASLIALARPAPDRIPPANSPHPATAPQQPREDRAEPDAATDASVSADPAGDSPSPTTPWRARPNLGTTLARAVRHGALPPDPTDDYLYTLIQLESDLLHPRLTPMTERLLRAGIAPDWAVLLDDLAWWDHDRDDVATRWRESFYLTLEAPSPTQEP